jgi:hypothetical protein
MTPANEPQTGAQVTPLASATLPATNELLAADLPAKDLRAGREITLKDSSPAIEMHVVVNGQIVRAVLSDASFNKTRTDQNAYAKQLGGRLATREENRAVVNDLIEKEKKGTLNTVETNLLKTYREKYVRDSQGGIGVRGRHLSEGYPYQGVDDCPRCGALVVLPLEESRISKASGSLEEKTSLSQEVTRDLITKAGGIFIGKEELVKLGKLAPDAVLPEIPAKYSQAFLESKHPLRERTLESKDPLRERTIASHIILGFDPETNQWHTIDRGEGGQSDIVPGSFGKDGKGLSGDKQDELLKKDSTQIKVEGVEISTHKDSLPIERMLDSAVALHFAAGKSIETAPFYGIWGRTGDTQNAASGCRRLLGNSYQNGVYAVDYYHSDNANYLVGLIAGWN